MVILEEAIVRLEIDPDFAIDYFRTRIFEVAEHLAAEFGRITPLPSASADDAHASTPFRNFQCARHHGVLAQVMEGVHQVIINDTSAIHKLQQDLEISPRIVFTHHEQPTILPQAATMDMLTIRTMNYVFHCLLVAVPSFNQRIFRILKNYASKGTIFGRSPQNLSRFLKESYDWAPTIVDTKLTADELIGGPSTFTNIAHLLFGVPFCWRGKVFSAHIKPSQTALQHRNIYASCLYLFAMEYIEKKKYPSVSSSSPSTIGEAQASSTPNPLTSSRNRDEIHVMQRVDFPRTPRRDTLRREKEREEELARRRRAEEERRTEEEEERRVEEERRAEEERRLEEERRIEEELRVEEERRVKEARRVEEERRIERGRLDEEQRRLEEEQQRIEEQRQKVERERREAEEKFESEQRRLDEERRAAAERRLLVEERQRREP